MKKVFIIYILLLIITNYGYSQKNDTVRFFDFGVGVGNDLHANHGALNIGYAKNINNYLIDFLEYNITFRSNQIYYHELSYKFGPYIRFWKESYFALSTGVSLLYNPNAYQTVVSDVDFMPEAKHNEKEWMLNIPIQARVNMNIYRDLYIGIKGTFNPIYTQYVNDRYIVLIFLSYNIK